MEQSYPPGQWQTPATIPPTPPSLPNAGPPYPQNGCCSEKFITKNSVITLLIIVALALIIYYGFVHFQREINNRLQYFASYQGMGGLAAYHPQERIIPRPPAGELASQQLDHRAKLDVFSKTAATKKVPITDLPINKQQLVVVEGAPIVVSPTLPDAS